MELSPMVSACVKILVGYWAVKRAMSHEGGVGCFTRDAATDTFYWFG
jgi:hypothetical protein